MIFTERVKNFCLQQRLFSNGDRVLVGISGGPDSMALLHALVHLRHFFGLQIYVAHLNHGLRRQARQEQLYVKKLCGRLGIPFLTKTVTLKKTKASLEEIAREARLKFFISTAKKNKISTIALGHHQDDLAETVLMRILRGAGPMGARGILPKRIIDGVTITRPFLGISRKQIKEFLAQQKVKFFTDASNRNKNFLRNKIRLELLPELQDEYNPNIKETLAHLSESLTLACDYIQIEAEKALDAVAQECSAKKICLNAQKAHALHPAVLREVIRLAVEKILGHTRRVTFAHVREIENLINTPAARAVV